MSQARGQGIPLWNLRAANQRRDTEANDPNTRLVATRGRDNAESRCRHTFLGANRSMMRQAHPLATEVRFRAMIGQ